MNTRRTTRKRKPKTVTTPEFRPHLRSLIPRLTCHNARVVLLGVIFCLAGLAAAAGSDSKKNAQKPYALICGTVWGPDSRPVYGVKVKIRRAGDKKARWELYSNHTGEFAQRVPAAREDYVIWADLSGYKSQDGKHLHPGEEARAHVEYDERVDTSLHLK